MIRFAPFPRRRLAAVLFAALLIAGLGVRLAAVDPPAGNAKAFGEASDAWGRGDYIGALVEFIRIMNEPDGSVYLDRIALQTGELYQSFELTPDGRNPRFSPDGRYIAYETGLEVSRRTRIVRNDGTMPQVVDLPGVGLAFAPTGARAAYLKIADTPELSAAAKALEDAALTAPTRGALVQALAWHVLKNTTITIVDLETRAEREVLVPGLIKSGLAWPVGLRLYFLGRPETDESRNDLYMFDEAATRPVVAALNVEEPRFKSAPVLDPTRRYFSYVAAPVDPLRRPPALPPPAGLLVPPTPEGSAGAPPQPSFAILDTTTGARALRTGTVPVFSNDGRSLAYVDRTATESRIYVGPPIGEVQLAKSIANTAGRLDAPALSADGSRIAYQQMTRDDWEMFVADRDGSNEIRLTRDPQHDLLPQFVAGDRVLEVIGEPRHRRSFLLDLKTGAPTRLFHNNTVRTITPEYQWVVSRDGNRLLIGAERDGNTVSPERGVYLMDLNRKVSKADLLRRLETNLARERALRESQTKAFAPIERDVRDAVGQVSVDRIYGYEKALFDFDSKHISRPGNRRAAEYLFSMYKSFGYEPEYQWFDNRQAAGGQTANVIARLPGTVHPELVYVISSHFDSVAVGPGADDDSSGTAALLEVARVLASKPQAATIIFASFTGEEAGLLGSQEFVRRAVDGKWRVMGALNNDMIGWANDNHLDNTIRYSNPGIRDIQHGAAMLFTRLVTYDALYFKGTDAVSYYDAYGDIVGGIGSYPVLSSPHYHQPHDLLEFENHDLIAETSKTTVATIMRLASSPARISGLKVASFAGGSVSLEWNASPERNIASYEVSAAAPGAVLSRTETVMAPNAVLQNVVPGTVITVRAINSKGLSSWDTASVMVGK